MLCDMSSPRTADSAIAESVHNNEQSVFLTPRDYTTLYLVAVGGALEFYDFVVFAFFVPVIGRIFFPANIPERLGNLEAFAIFGAGYLARPLGGIVLQYCGSLFGRQRVFAFPILLMTISTCGIAVLPDYASAGIFAPFLLLLMRILQGAAFGGEVPGAWISIAEHLPLGRIGFACGIVCGGLSTGMLLGSIAAAVLNSVLTLSQLELFGWRLPFLLGGGFGVVAVYLRRWLQETPNFVEMKRTHLLVEELPLRVIIRQYPSGVIISILLTWVLSACIVVVSVLNVTVLQTYYRYSAEDALIANSVGSLLSIFGMVAVGAIVSKVGSGPLLIFGGIFFGITTYAFYSYVGHSLLSLFALYALMGLSVGIAGVGPYVMIRAFPAAARFTCISFSYNVSCAIFGGSTPVIVAWFAQADAMVYAYYLLFIALLAFCIGVYLLFAGLKVEHDRGAEEGIGSIHLIGTRFWRLHERLKNILGTMKRSSTTQDMNTPLDCIVGTISQAEICAASSDLRFQSVSNEAG